MLYVDTVVAVAANGRRSSKRRIEAGRPIVCQLARRAVDLAHMMMRRQPSVSSVNLPQISDTREFVDKSGCAGVVD